MSHENLKAEDWAIDGKEDEVLTVGVFNSWLKRYLNIHVTPMHQMMCETHKILADHVAEEKVDHAYYKGMFKAILWMIPIVNAGVVAVVWWLHKAGLITIP